MCAARAVLARVGSGCVWRLFIFNLCIHSYLDGQLALASVCNTATFVPLSFFHWRYIEHCLSYICQHYASSGNEGVITNVFKIFLQCVFVCFVHFEHIKFGKENVSCKPNVKSTVSVTRAVCPRNCWLPWHLFAKLVLLQRASLYTTLSVRLHVTNKHGQFYILSCCLPVNMKFPAILFDNKLPWLNWVSPTDTGDGSISCACLLHLPLTVNTHVSASEILGVLCQSLGINYAVIIFL